MWKNAIMRVICLAQVLILLLGAVSVGVGDSLMVGDFSSGGDTKGVPVGWRLKERFAHADLSLIQVDGVHAVQLRSTGTSFSLQRPIKIDTRQYPILSWKWKISKLPVGADFRRTKTDDQAAQLFILFSRTRSIVYLWDTSAPQGLMADAPSPPLMSVKAVVVRSGLEQTGQWLTETRNVCEDYRKFYGAAEKPPAISGIRLQINTQHTKSTGESAFAEVLFRSALESEKAVAP